MNKTTKWAALWSVAGLFALSACVAVNPAPQEVSAQSSSSAQSEQQAADQQTSDQPQPVTRRSANDAASKQSSQQPGKPESSETSDKTSQQSDKKSRQSAESAESEQTSVSKGDHSKQAEKLHSTFDSLKKQISEAEKTLQELTMQRNKAEFHHEMKLNLVQMEQDLSQVRKDIQQEVQQLQDKIDQHQQQLAEIEKKRAAFSESLSQLDPSSGGEWKSVREDIKTAWNELQSAHREAKEQMDGSKTAQR